MSQASLLQGILATCRGRQFNTVDDLASQLPDASYEVIETTVVGAIRRGLLRGRISETELLDGSILVVSDIRSKNGRDDCERQR